MRTAGGVGRDRRHQTWDPGTPRPQLPRPLAKGQAPTIPRPVSTQLAAIAQLGLGDDWLRAVLWRNGVRLLGIAGPDW